MTEVKKYPELHIWVDGASRGNPGPSSAGVVIRDPRAKTLKTLSMALGISTNNVAEYAALLLALQEALALHAKKVRIFTDSELVARHWSGEYKIKDATLAVFFRLAVRMKDRFESLTVSHVPREQNREADDAANQALNQGGLFA